MNPREDVLTTAADIVTSDRNLEYGPPEQNFTRIADLWNAFLKGRVDPSAPVLPYETAILVLLIKVARIQVSPEQKDHWVDIAGYAACGWDALRAGADQRVPPSPPGSDLDDFTLQELLEEVRVRTAETFDLTPHAPTQAEVEEFWQEDSWRHVEDALPYTIRRWPRNDAYSEVVHNWPWDVGTEPGIVGNT